MSRETPKGGYLGLQMCLHVHGSSFQRGALLQLFLWRSLVPVDPLVGRSRLTMAVQGCVFVLPVYSLQAMLHCHTRHTCVMFAADVAFPSWLHPPTVARRDPRHAPPHQRHAGEGRGHTRPHLPHRAPRARQVTPAPPRASRSPGAAGLACAPPPLYCKA